MRKPGKLIVLDGLDGSGKTTQFALVQESLRRKDIHVKPISFPDYAEPSSALVKMYLRGDFSKDCGEVNAFAASSFYAVDRFASFRRFWQQDYENGSLILASRYVSSNAIHQMPKLPPEEWDAYLDWLSDYEYHKLGLPQPDAILFLDMPPSVSQSLLTERYGGDESKRDIHEANTDYLAACREAALYAARKQHWAVIPCGSGDKPFSREHIQQEILNHIHEVL